jgi:hypothetical protein
VCVVQRLLSRPSRIYLKSSMSVVLDCNCGVFADLKIVSFGESG